jgi:hypothetical protein
VNVVDMDNAAFVPSAGNRQALDAVRNAESGWQMIVAREAARKTWANRRGRTTKAHWCFHVFSRQFAVENEHPQLVLLTDRRLLPEHFLTSRRRKVNGFFASGRDVENV